MRLTRIHAKAYRCLEDVAFDVRPLNVLIGPNASGKSTVLDALRFLKEAVEEGNYGVPTARRGGFANLAWKGGPWEYFTLETTFEDEKRVLEWRVVVASIDELGMPFMEELWVQDSPQLQRRLVLKLQRGHGYWMHGEERIRLQAESNACGLLLASWNADFPGVGLREFIESWSFFDPNTTGLRQKGRHEDSSQLAYDGENLAARLFRIQQESPDRLQQILDTCRRVLGVPESLEFHADPETGRIHFSQREAWLHSPVRQASASSGTLRFLALLTALLGADRPSLIGIEEPENHLHPSAIDGLVQVLEAASREHQVLVSTHWPGLLDHLSDPASVCVVRKEKGATQIARPADPDRIRRALQESGFGLGEYFSTTGFGA